MDYKSGSKDGKSGALLLTTALIYHRQKIQDERYFPNFPHMSAEDQSILALAVLEAEMSRTDVNILGSTTQNAGYQQQLSNMDIVFNFFLWCSIAKVELRDRLPINVFLYLLGQRIQGKEKVTEALASTSCKLRGLSRYLNKSAGIHMPPYAISASRVSDMVAVFGGVRWDKLRRPYYHQESVIVIPPISG